MMNYSLRSFGIIAALAVMPMMFIYHTKLYDYYLDFPVKPLAITTMLNEKLLAVSNMLNQKPLPVRRMPSSQKFDKWIVVTTINYPTDAVKALANQTGWHVVIVADKKTPTDWNLAGCDFLSIDMQEQLNYAVSSLIPYNSYTRKMIGYLYAIQNGAQWIYDTDDDNQPVDVGIKLFDTQPFVSGLSYGKECYQDCTNVRPLFNAYAFWGQPKIWPRGYPLEEVRKVNNETQYTLCKTQKVPAIQQGLVLQDPDVDAVYRLLNADEATGLDVNFNKHAPPIILNPGTFCPFNSQNTLFHYNGFWSLFLPVSVAFRVTDIWRGYFAQKLLHLTGNRLGFYPVNAVQKRNAHSYLADFKDEAQLYADAGKMVEFISKWTCKHNLFKECVQQLSSEFLEKKFWGEPDVALANAWIRDLDAIGYVFPSLVSFPNDKSKEVNFNISNDCRKASLYFPVVKKKSNQIRKTYDDLKHWCNEALPANEAFTSSFEEKKHLEQGIWKNISRMALVVSGNYPYGPTISIMQRLYGNHFATVIFCGTIDPLQAAQHTGFLPLLDYNYIYATEKEINRGFRAYICTAKAIELRLQNIDGYVTIADDTQYNFWADFDYSRFRLYGSEWMNWGGPWWTNNDVGRNAMKRAIDMITSSTQLNSSSSLAKAFAEYTKAVGGDGFSTLRAENMWSISDFYYLPKENDTVFYEMAEVFFEANLFHEIAVPKIGAGLQWLKYHKSTEMDIKEMYNLWGDNRANWERLYTKSLIYLHPIKLSTVKELKERNKYCNFVIRTYFSSLSNEPAAKLPSVPAAIPPSVPAAKLPSVPAAILPSVPAAKLPSVPAAILPSAPNVPIKAAPVGR